MIVEILLSVIGIRRQTNSTEDFGRMDEQTAKKELFTKYRVENPHYAKGSYGSVAKARDSNNKSVVIKAISNKVNPRWINNEIVCGTLLKGHSNIPTMRETLSAAGFHFFVFDFVDGIELFEFMEKTSFSPLDEGLAKHIFRQLLDSIKFCHDNGIAHRDLKLENVMIDSNFKLFLVDFGLAAINHLAQEKFIVAEYVGSENYTAPEVLRRTPYNPFLADVWSMGIILFCNLFGQYPWDGSLFGQKDKQPPTLEFPKERQVSDEAKDLLARMLHHDPACRASVNEILQHDWLR